MGIGKSEFVTKTQFLSKFFQKNSFIRLKKNLHLIGAIEKCVFTQQQSQNKNCSISNLEPSTWPALYQKSSSY